MRSSGGGVRECSRRSGCLAASVVLLAACGDNLAAPRLATARYVYDDGTEQIDRHQLYDRTLGTLCEPTVFSDGATYCKPPTDDAFYADKQCSHVISRVPTGETPRAYTSTTFELGSISSPSRVFRVGAATTAPTQRWRRVDNYCFAYPLDGGYDYYEVVEAVDLARVRTGLVETVGEWQVDHIEAVGLSLPWRLEDPSYGPCNIVDRPGKSTTWCHPTAAQPVSLYADAGCTMPMILAESVPPLAFLIEDYFESNIFYKPGLELDTDTEYSLFGGECLAQRISGAHFRMFTLGETVPLPTLSRSATGSRRLQSIALGALPFPDELLHDTTLDTDCELDRDRDLCLPVEAAPIETWFADPLCGQPIDVALVPADTAWNFGRRSDGYPYYTVGAVYSGQLYELDTGDTCSTWFPAEGWIPHSIGPALGEDAFARATLMIE